MLEWADVSVWAVSASLLVSVLPGSALHTAPFWEDLIVCPAEMLEGGAKAAWHFRLHKQRRGKQTGNHVYNYKGYFLKSKEGSVPLKYSKPNQLNQLLLCISVYVLTSNCEWRGVPNSFLYSSLMSSRSISDLLTSILVRVDSVVPAPWTRHKLGSSESN